MATEQQQTNLRIPADLKSKLQRAADDNNRSLTGEVLARLEGTFDADKGANGALAVDEHTLDLFAEKVGQVLDEREKKKRKV